MTKGAEDGRRDWVEEGFTPEQAQFLMASAITHHRPLSAVAWGEYEVRRLLAELASVDEALEAALGAPAAG